MKYITLKRKFDFSVTIIPLGIKFQDFPIKDNKKDVFEMILSPKDDLFSLLLQKFTLFILQPTITFNLFFGYKRTLSCNMCAIVCYKNINRF